MDTAVSYRIRRETPDDYEEVHLLVQKAFAKTSYSDGTEGEYLRGVRKKAAFLPDLSLVAEEAETGRLIGQIVLYETEITTDGGPVTGLVLSPISVHPAYFRRGIARGMMERAFSIAREKGYPAVFLCGEPNIYHRLGFQASYRFGIHHKSDRAAEWCMGMELTPGALRNITGTIDIV